MPLLVMSPGQVYPSWGDFVASLAANEHQASKDRGLVVLSWSLECHTTLNAIPCILYIKPTTTRVLHMLEICSKGLGMWFGNLYINGCSNRYREHIPASQDPETPSPKPSTAATASDAAPCLCPEKSERSFRQAMPLISHWRGANTCWKDSILQFGSLKCVNFHGHIPLNLKFVQVPFYCFIQL